MPDSSHLTPVRIRGKKQQSKSADASPISPTVLQRTSSQSSSPSPGRPRRTQKERPQGPGLSPSQFRTTSVTSALERLPTELLEDIFFRCLNLSLPRASLALGQQLASYHVKSKLYAIAFSGVPNNPEAEMLGHWLEARDLLIEVLLCQEDERGTLSGFQSDILALKWMTPIFLRHLMDRLLVKKTVMAFDELDIGWINCEKTAAQSSSPQPSNASSESITEAMTEFYKAVRSNTHSMLSSIDAESGWWCYETNKEEVSFNLRLHQSFPHTVNIQVYTSGLNFDTGPYPLRTRFIDYGQLLFCPGRCRIPQKLLHGPWSIPKCAMLAQLSKSGCSLDRSGSTTDEEVASQGLKDAIAESSIRAIVTLVGSRRMYKEGCGDAECPLCKRGYGRKCSGIVHKSHVGVFVTTEHLKFALDKISSLEVLECMLDAMDTDIDWQDKEVQRYIWETDDDRRSFLRNRCGDDDEIKRYTKEIGEEPGIYEQKAILSAPWIRIKPSWHGEREHRGSMEAHFMTA